MSVTREKLMRGLVEEGLTQRDVGLVVVENESVQRWREIGCGCAAPLMRALVEVLELVVGVEEQCCRDSLGGRAPGVC